MMLEKNRRSVRFFYVVLRSCLDGMSETIKEIITRYS